MSYLKGGFGDVPSHPGIMWRPRPDAGLSGPIRPSPHLLPWTGCRVPAYPSHLTCVKPGSCLTEGVGTGHVGSEATPRGRPPSGTTSCADAGAGGTLRPWEVPKSTATSPAPCPSGSPLARDSRLSNWSSIIFLERRDERKGRTKRRTCSSREVTLSVSGCYLSKAAG